MQEDQLAGYFMPSQRSPDSEIRSWVEDREEGSRTERLWEARFQAGSGAHSCTSGDYGSEGENFEIQANPGYIVSSMPA